MAPAYRVQGDLFDPEPYVRMFPDAPDESPRFEIAMTWLQLWCHEFAALAELGERVLQRHGLGLEWLGPSFTHAREFERSLHRVNGTAAGALPWPAATAYLVDVVERSVDQQNPLGEATLATPVKDDREVQIALARRQGAELVVAMRREGNSPREFRDVVAYGYELLRSVPVAQVLVVSPDMRPPQPVWVEPTFGVVPLKTSPVHQALSALQRNGQCPSPRHGHQGATKRGHHSCAR